MTPQQQAFLAHIGSLIPKLFDAIRLGNVKSECVLGDRIIGHRQVRLKLVAEVVDPGSNPLATHSTASTGTKRLANTAHPAVENSGNSTDKRLKDNAKRSSRRKHPLSRT